MAKRNVGLETLIILHIYARVECRATAGNDESTSLMCYQKSEKAPLYEPITYSSSHIIAFFWMNVKYPH